MCSGKSNLQRPDYGSFRSVVVPTLWFAVWRVGVISVIACLAITPVLNALVGVLVAREWSDAAIFSLLINGCHSACYIMGNGFFFSVDMLGWISLQRMPRKHFMKPSAALMKRTLVEAATSQLIVGPLLGYALFHPLCQYFGVPAPGSPLPSPLKCFALVIFAYFFNDIMFYITHRTLHHPLLYARFHKQHHTYTGTMSITAEFASPVEVATSNQFPTIGGLILLGAHPTILLVWLAQRLLQTYEAHSGYDLENTIVGRFGLSNHSGAAFHDYHHTVNRGNYSSPFTDWLGGTMDGWLAMGGRQGYMGLHDKWSSDAKAKADDVIGGGGHSVLSQ